jgi:hypothetical protein
MFKIDTYTRPRTRICHLKEAFFYGSGPPTRRKLLKYIPSYIQFIIAGPCLIWISYCSKWHTQSVLGCSASCNLVNTYQSPRGICSFLTSSNTGCFKKSFTMVFQMWRVLRKPLHLKVYKLYIVQSVEYSPRSNIWNSILKLFLKHPALPVEITLIRNYLK